MKTRQQVLAELATRYARQWRAWVIEPDAGTWPLTLTLRPPRRADLDRALAEADEHIRAWTSFEQEHPLVEVEWVSRRTAVGSQELPTRLRLGSPPAVAATVGREHHFATATTRWATLSAEWPDHPRLRTALTEAMRLDENDFTLALGVASWLTEHPHSGLMPRQLPVEGIDTKWVTSHSRLLTLLASPDVTNQVATPSTGVTCRDSWMPEHPLPADEDLPVSTTRTRDDTGTGGDEEVVKQIATLNALGLRPRPSYVRIALLDPADRTQFAGIRDLAVSSEQLALLTVQPRHLIVIENLETALTMPDMDGTVVIHSLGHNLAPLRHLAWAQHAEQVTYWGDLDTEGFTILSAFRGLGYPACSVLMDEPTLLRYLRFAVEDAPTPDRGDLSNLTQIEYDTWQGLISDRWGRRLRLEQERIPLAVGVQALRAAFGH